MTAQMYRLVNGQWNPVGGRSTPTFTPRAKLRLSGISAVSVPGSTSRQFRVFGLKAAVTTSDGGGTGFDRDTLVYGAYNPKETGYYGPNPGTVFTTIGGPAVGAGQDFNVTANNQVVKNLIVYGSINLGSFSGVTVQDCIVYGTLMRGSNAPCIVAQGNNYRGARIVDCRLTQRVDNHNEWANALFGGNFTVERCEIDNQPDGISLNNRVGNVNILGCYIHQGWFNEWTAAEGSNSAGTDTYHGLPVTDVPKPEGYFPYSTGTAHYTHADGIQFYITSNVVIRGNYIGGHHVNGDHNATPSQLDLIRQGHDYYNSCILLKQEGDSSTANKITNVLIENNYLYGATCSFNLPWANGNSFETATIQNNWFLKGDWSPIYYVLRSKNTAGVYLGNMINNRLVDPVTYADLGAVPITNGN